MQNRRSRQPLLDEFYHKFLATERSADFIESVSRHYNLAALYKLAAGGHRISRRGAVLAIGFMGDFRSNTVLGEALHDEDRAVRLLADHGIRQLWMRVGNPALESGLRHLERLNQQGRFADAIEWATDMIELNEGIAECWHERAVGLYHLEDYSHAVCDSRQALELNPYHFLAALTAANSQLELGDVVQAILEFRCALDINPDLELVRSQISHLERIVEEG